MITENSKVLIPDGTVKYVQDLKPGDEILSYRNNIEEIISINKSEYSGPIYKIKTQHYSEECEFSEDSILFYRKRFFIEKDIIGNNITFKDSKKYKIYPEKTVLKSENINRRDFVLLSCNIKDANTMSLLDGKILNYFLLNGRIFFKKRLIFRRMMSYVIKFEIKQLESQKSNRAESATSDISDSIYNKMQIRPTLTYKSKNTGSKKIVIFYANKKLHDFISKHFIVNVPTKEKYYRRYFIESMSKKIVDKFPSILITFKTNKSFIKIQQSKIILNRLMIPFRYNKYKFKNFEGIKYAKNSYYIDNNPMVKIVKIHKELYNGLMYEIITKSGYYNSLGIVCK